MNLYRYEVLMCGYEVIVSLIKYSVLKETEKGYWIKIYDKKKFILKKDGKKRFARTTKKKALEDLLARKKAFLGYAESNVINAKYQIEIVEDEIRRLK